MRIDRKAVVTMALPGSVSPRTVRMPCSGQISLQARIGETIKRFAREFGVSPLAVDYEVRIMGGK